MRTVYWCSALILCLFLLWSAYTYLFSKATITGVRELGFPDYFRVQLAVLKLLAILILLLPQLPIQVKEWGYAGVALFFITAIVAHTAHKDPFAITLINLFLICILGVSRYTLYQVSCV